MSKDIRRETTEYGARCTQLDCRPTDAARDAMKLLAFMVVLIAAPSLAQPRVGSVRQSPFIAGEARIYDQKGDFIGTARDNPFIPGRTDLYDSTGRSTGIELRENPFDPDRSDVFDHGSDHKH